MGCHLIWSPFFLLNASGWSLQAYLWQNVTWAFTMGGTRGCGITAGPTVGHRFHTTSPAGEMLGQPQCCQTLSREWGGQPSLWDQSAALCWTFRLPGVICPSWCGCVVTLPAQILAFVAAVLQICLSCMGIPERLTPGLGMPGAPWWNCL